MIVFSSFIFFFVRLQKPKMWNHGFRFISHFGPWGAGNSTVDCENRWTGQQPQEHMYYRLNVLICTCPEALSRTAHQYYNTIALEHSDPGLSSLSWPRKGAVYKESFLTSTQYTQLFRTLEGDSQWFASCLFHIFGEVSHHLWIWICPAAETSEASRFISVEVKWVL